MDRENYYILLELPFDPPEENEGTIRKAIEGKQSQWSRDQLKSFLKARASKNLEMIPDMQKVMTDPQLRRQEAKEARRIRDAKLPELTEKLKIYRSKGEKLDPRDLKKVASVYSPYGFSAKKIQEIFQTIPDPAGSVISVSDVITKQQADNISNYLRQLGTPHITLYEFLGTSSSASAAEMVQKGGALQKKVRESGAQKGIDAAKGSLAGLIVELFRDEAGKKRYDNYIEITKYGDLNDLIDEMARGNRNTIDQNLKNALIDSCLKSHREVSLSEASAYIDSYCAFRNYKVTGNTVHCATCNIDYPAGTETCPKCGKHIIITCPRCGRANDNITKTCQCGFSLEMMEPVQEDLAGARQAFASRQYTKIEPLLIRPRSYWPENKDLKALESDLGGLQKKYADLLASIEGQVRAKNFYAARKLIQEGKASGFPVGTASDGPYVIDAALAGRVDDRIRQVEQKLDSLRNLSPDQAFETLIALSEQISDCPSLQQQLRNFPPEPVSSVTVVKSRGNASISWKPSSSRGSLEYVLVRKENAWANGTKEKDPTGTEVYRGRDVRFTDSGLRDSTVYCYCVITVRAGVQSSPARLEAPVVFVGNVTDVSVKGGDGILTLNWKAPEGVTGVKLWISRSESQPSEPSAYRPYPCQRLDGETIAGLVNGSRYWVRIQALHTVSGRAYPSEDLVLSGVPEKPAAPMRNFAVRFEDGHFSATWDRAEWDAILFCSDRKPEYSPGSVYDLSDLQARFTKLDITLRSSTEAEFSHPFSGRCYIIPGLIRASNVVLGQAAAVSNIPAVRNPSSDINAGATEMYVNFDWPKKLDRVLLCFRTDAYPAGPEDPAARKAEVTRRQYDQDAGIIIKNPEMGVFYAALYGFADAEGERIYGEGVPFEIHNEPQRTVYYQVTYGGGGFFSRKKKLTIRIRSDGDFVFPPFALVGRTGVVPGSRDKGSDIVVEDSPMEVHGSVTLDYEGLTVQKGTKVRMFFLKNSDYKRFKIQNEGSIEIG